MAIRDGDAKGKENKLNMYKKKNQTNASTFIDRTGGVACLSYSTNCVNVLWDIYFIHTHTEREGPVCLHFVMNKGPALMQLQ